MTERRILYTLHVLLTICSPKCCVANIREGTHIPQSDARPYVHRVVVIYSIDQTAGGLVNQLLCHVGAFLFAVPLKAEIVLPEDALSRDSYRSAFWEQQWHRQPLGTLLDVERIVQRWHRHGVVVHKVRDCTSTDSMSGYRPDCIITSCCHSCHGSQWSLEAASTDTRHQRELHTGSWSLQIPSIVELNPGQCFYKKRHSNAPFGLENGLGTRNRICRW